MKYLSYLTLIIFTLLSCNPKKIEADKITIIPKKIIGKKFFEYDQIDYYFNDFDEKNSMNYMIINLKLKLIHSKWVLFWIEFLKIV